MAKKKKSRMGRPPRKEGPRTKQIMLRLYPDEQAVIERFAVGIERPGFSLAALCREMLVGFAREADRRAQSEDALIASLRKTRDELAAAGDTAGALQAEVQIQQAQDTRELIVRRAREGRVQLATFESVTISAPMLRTLLQKMPDQLFDLLGSQGVVGQAKKDQEPEPSKGGRKGGTKR